MAAKAELKDALADLDSFLSNRHNQHRRGKYFRATLQVQKLLAKLLTCDEGSVQSSIAEKVSTPQAQNAHCATAGSPTHLTVLWCGDTLCEPLD